MEPIGHHKELFWPSEPDAYGSKARRGGLYRAFIPDHIASRDFLLSGEASTALHDATKALAALAEEPLTLAKLGAVAQNLLRSESVASSRIEGVAISHKRLARAAYQSAGRRRGDNRAAEVLGNVEAMKRAIEFGEKAEPFAVGDILDIHRTLLRHTDDREIAGVIRKKQNWIGGNDYNPVGATYVPPPPEYLDDLLEDLCRFINRSDMHPVAQAAIAHAQFENIHPFADGNGRTGRAVIYTTLRRSGEIRSYIPPISLVLGREPNAYVNGFGAYSQGNVSAWCTTFSDATARAARAARQLADDIEHRQEVWLERLGKPRKDATVRLLVEVLPEQPVIDVPTGQRLSGKSHVAVGNAISQLEAAGVLVKLNERRWGRVWECGEVLELIDDFEKSVSTP
ncbi:MAG: Fic family protein [Solirubrobacterales bacterium]